MFKNLKIGPRLLSLISVQIVVSLIIGAMAFLVLEFASDTTSELNRRVASQAKLAALAEGLRSELAGTVNDVEASAITWEEARENLSRSRAYFEEGWQDYLADLTADETEFAVDVFGPHLENVRGAFEGLDFILESQDYAAMSRYVTTDLNTLVGPFLNALVASTTLERLEAESALIESQAANAGFRNATLSAIVLGVLLALVLGLIVYRSITGPVEKIANTVRGMSEGDFEVRTKLEGRNELSRLGSAFDQMLNERVATLSKVEEENRRLNEGVIRLLEAVAKLSRRDLTVKVPVTEDVTGPVADSLNLLTDETAKVLQGVRTISVEVSKASGKVKQQSDAVIDVAAHERKEVEATAKHLADAAEHMTRIAKLAQSSNEAAEKAMKTTQTAMSTVNNTVTGINDIRDTIRETEKRIKRLGERSQEISGVVNLINTIAERTHILALNASMHAASAGEAGRGFAVVADEVQRLAENARDATSQISTLVSNIQVETADTVTTMNEAISQVVSGSKLAEEAGQQMRDTNESTAELVAMVQKIALGSRKQAQTSVQLSKRAHAIRESTQQTSEQLRAQSKHTDMLVNHAASLVSAVSVFTLPEAHEVIYGPDDTRRHTVHELAEVRPIAVNE